MKNLRVHPGCLSPIYRVLLLICCVCAAPASAAEELHSRKTRNVFFITIDGFRWQELFNGADAGLIDSPAGGVRAKPELKQEFVRQAPAQSRAAVMPFLWSVIARDGQIFGDASAGSPARVTNGLKFSYPGYNEMLCGHPDPRIDSNSKTPNPNVNVLEWLNGLPEFRGRVAAYGTWDRLAYILNAGRSRLPVHCGWDALADDPLSDGEREINAWLPDLPRIWDDNALDVVAGRAAIEYVKKNQPRVFYLMFGETDEWAHLRRYDCYLQAARNNDRYIAGLWKMLQSMPQYAGQTSLVITTDHGRGRTRKDWTDHGKETEGAEFVWMAVLGPDTPPLGIRKNQPVTQSQIAATLAALLGADYPSAVTDAAPPLPGIVHEEHGG